MGLKLFFTGFKTIRLLTVAALAASLDSYAAESIYQCRGFPEHRKFSGEDFFHNALSGYI